MLSCKLLLRAAKRMHDAWDEAAARAVPGVPYLLARLERHQHVLQHARRRLDRARLERLAMIQPYLQQVMMAQLGELRDACEKLLDHLKLPPVVVPAVRFLLEELHQVAVEFGDLTIDWKGKAIAVTTEPITLEGIHLGPFAIRFFWERLPRALDHLCFDVVALDPNPAGNYQDVTHPHVRHKKVCAGEATLPLKKALQQGRLADAFSLIRSVLLTYNRGSPYVHLEEWEGRTCHDCDRSVSTDDLRCCESCGQDFCDDCMSYCSGCDNSRCDGCMDACVVCQESCCQGCLRLTSASSRSCCPGCRQICPACGAVFATDEAVEDSGLCPGCRLRRPVADNPAGVHPSPGTAISPPTMESPHVSSLEPDAHAPTPT